MRRDKKNKVRRHTFARDCKWKMLHVNKQQPGLSAGSASGFADQGCMRRLTDVAHLDRFDSFA